MQTVNKLPAIGHVGEQVLLKASTGTAIAPFPIPGVYTCDPTQTDSPTYPWVWGVPTGTPGVELLSVNVALTSAQLRALRATPITLVAAPGSGKMIMPVSAVITIIPGTVPYDASAGGDLMLMWGSKQFATSHSPTALKAILEQTVNSTIIFDLSTIVSQIDTRANLNNVALLLKNSGAGEYNIGPINASALNAGGTGYAVNDIGTIDGTAGDAAYIVDSVDAITGAVKTYHLTAAGTKYAIANGVTTTPDPSTPAGSGFKVNITDAGGNGSAFVDLAYMIL